MDLGNQGHRSSLIQVDQWTKAWATPRFRQIWEPLNILIYHNRIWSSRELMLLLPNFHAFSFGKALNFLLWCQSLTNSNNKGYRWVSCRDPGTQGHSDWFREWSCERIGTNEKPLGCWWECWDQGTSFFCLFVLLCFFEALDLVLPSCDCQGWRCQWPPGKAQGWTQWGKDGAKN